MALARKYKIIKESDFKRVFKEGRTIRNSFFFFRFYKNSLNKNRYAVVVPKTVSKKATRRNKLKRYISEIIKYSSFGNNTYDLVITTSSPILEKSFREIKGLIDEIIKKEFVKWKKSPLSL